MTKLLNYVSYALNVVFIALFLFGSKKYHETEKGASNTPLRSQSEKGLLIGKELKWHGGHPVEDKTGSCWCGHDKYCMCTPSLAIDLIIVSGGDHIWLVRRKDTNQLATMGGFVDVGETIEDAVRRELSEEMGVEISNERTTLFGVYSDPRRDSRRHTASVTFAVELHAEIQPRAGDDAKAVERIPLSEIEQHDFFADHRTILLDYKRSRHQSSVSEYNYGDFANDIARSTCRVEL